MNREARIWRRLAIAGAGTIGLLVTRIFVSPQTPLYRWLRPGEPNWRKLRDDEIKRRLHACEMNLQNIWEHLNGNPGNR